MTGGSVAGGGSPGSGGVSGTGGTAGSSGAFGMPCASNEDCPPDAICCDGSDESCDGTRLPSGDGGNPGEFVASGDGLTVTDTITGLVWQREDRSPRQGCTYPSSCTLEEARAYCASLELGGLSGWRLPGAMGILTLLDPMGPTNPDGFPEWPGFDWTSAMWRGYGVYLEPGHDILMYSSVEDTKEVRCVRGSRCYPKSRFVALAGGLVRDALTGLEWQEQGSPTGMTWADGQSYCSSLGSGFRLPTVKEMLSLLGLSSGPTTAFPGGVPGPFWTSTPDEGPLDEPYARHANYFNYEENTVEWGWRYSYPVSTAINVRCVR